MNFESLIKALNTFLDLGVPVIAPTLLFVLALIFRVRLGRAVRAAITYGIGFVGIFLVLNMMLAALVDAGKLLVQNAGMQLEVMDVGWPVLAAVAFGVPTFVTVFLGAIVVNLVMFVMKWTKTLDIDFHNYYHWVFPATVVYFATNNLIAGTIVGLVFTVITLKLADWSEKTVAEWWDLPGISISHGSTIGWYPLCYALDWIIDRIPGVNKIRVDVSSLQERLGVLGEPMLIGVIIGVGMGIFGRMPIKDTLTLAMNLGAAMVLMPRMISLLMEGLVPIFQAARKWVLDKFPGYDFRVGLDAAVLVGKPEVLVIGMLMIPVIILLAFVLPGNKVMPFADLAILGFVCSWSVGVNRGNLFRAFIISTIICAAVLYGSGYAAPTLTEMARQSGFQPGEEVAGLFTSLETGFITGAGGTNLIAYMLVNQKLNAWLVALFTVLAGAVLLPLYRWIVTRPRLAADLSPEQRSEVYPTGQSYPEPGKAVAAQ